MRVAQVSGFLDPARRTPEALLQAWPTLRMVAQAVQRAGAEVEVFQAAHRQALLRVAGTRFHFRSGGRAGAPLAWLSLARAVAAYRPDVVHLHGFAFPVLARLLGRALPHVPLLLQDHADRPFGRPRRLVQRWGLSGAGGAAFTAAEMATPFIEAGVLARTVRIYSVPEASSWFTPGDQQAARARTGLRGHPAVLWVGRLDRNKDPTTALDAFERAAAVLPEAHLWCCFSSAPVLRTLRARVAASRLLAGRVHLLGAVAHERVEQLCRAADLFLAASHREGSGYAVIEAFACGTPAVLTDIPAFRALTGGGACATLVPPGDAAAMADALIGCARADPEPLRRAVREHFDRALSPEALGRQLVAVYQSLQRAGGA